VAIVAAMITLGVIFGKSEKEAAPSAKKEGAEPTHQELVAEVRESRSIVNRYEFLADWQETGGIAMTLTLVAAAAHRATRPGTVKLDRITPLVAGVLSEYLPTWFYEKAQANIENPPALKEIAGWVLDYKIANSAEVVVKEMPDTS
jgi:hypothetical protein